jgi:hypothetical protein
MKYLLLFIIILLRFNCATVSRPSISESLPSFKDELNKSIFDGFYDNDSTKITKDSYFVK